MEADEPPAATPPGGARTIAPWISQTRDLSRLMALSDGIFAFAMTLLVLSLVVPAGFGSSSNVPRFLRALWPAFLAYLLSFLVIYLYWREHAQVFRYVVSYGWTLANLNIAFLLCVAIMPFVTDLLAVAGQSVWVVLVYAGTQIAASLSLYALWTYASDQHRHIDPSVPRTWVDYVRRSVLVVPILFAVATPFALWNPYLTEGMWFAAMPAAAWFRHRARIRAERAEERATGTTRDRMPETVAVGGPK